MCLVISAFTSRPASLPASNGDPEFLWYLCFRPK